MNKATTPLTLESLNRGVFKCCQEVSASDALKLDLIQKIPKLWLYINPASSVVGLKKFTSPIAIFAILEKKIKKDSWESGV